MVRFLSSLLLVALSLVSITANAQPAPSVPAANPALPPQPAVLPPLPGAAAANSPAVPAVSLPTLPSAPGAATPPVPPMPSSAPKPNENASAQPPIPADPNANAPAAQATGPSAEAQSSAADTKMFSYGRSNLSILFLPQQITRMKDAISYYESMDHSAVVAAPVPQPVAPVQVEEVKEPADYPVFFLSSILYDNQKEWSIWMAGHKITSQKNDTDVRVLSVSPESVTFSWSPEYSKMIKRRRTENALASTDKVKNKLAVQQRISWDDLTGTITFTLRQNQSFAVGYYSIFEGYMDSPKLLPLAPVNQSADFSPAAQGLPPGVGANLNPSGMPTIPPGAMPPSDRPDMPMPPTSTPPGINPAISNGAPPTPPVPSM